MPDDDCPESDTLVHGHIRSDLGTRADDDVHRVREARLGTDPCPFRSVDPVLVGQTRADDARRPGPTRFEESVSCPEQYRSRNRQRDEVTETEPHRAVLTVRI